MEICQERKYQCYHCVLALATETLFSALAFATETLFTISSLIRYQYQVLSLERLMTLTYEVNYKQQCHFYL